MEFIFSEVSSLAWIEKISLQSWLAFSFCQVLHGYPCPIFMLTSQPWDSHTTWVVWIWTPNPCMERLEVLISHAKLFLSSTQSTGQGKASLMIDHPHLKEMGLKESTASKELCWKLNADFLTPHPFVLFKIFKIVIHRKKSSHYDQTYTYPVKVNHMKLQIFDCFHLKNGNFI